MKRPMKAVMGVVGVLLVVFLVRACAGAKPGGERKGGGAIPVTVANVVATTAPVDLRTFGTVQALSTVDIKSQISGILTIVHVREGQDVKEGDLLFTIDPRPQQAMLQQAEAHLARDTAQYQNAEKELARQQELLKKGMAAEDAYDQANATAESAAAVVQADEADVATAKLQLEYCEIRAPFAGRTGELPVDQGNLVKSGDATLLTINQIVPIQVNFSLPQQELQRVRDEIAKGPLTIVAYDPADPAHSETGTLVFVDNQVDQQTGTVRLKGTFQNEDGRLWPGEFVNVVLTLSIQPAAILVPAAAVQTGQQGPFVFVVNPDMTVVDRVVTVDRAMNGDTVISSGLKAGEKVVTDGQLQLTRGSKIEVKPSAAASTSQGP
jgi:membrane fusion protein, multidrug efflux system